MKFGRFDIELYNFGFFRLDGGAMFGSVPKNLWAKKINADEENCIALATRSLVIRDGKKLILVDTGMGSKWSEKEIKIFAISPNTQKPSFKENEVTDVILTHLHFDHAGGISQRSPDGSKLELTYPNATVHLQRENIENAKQPTVKERASYLPDNWGPVMSGKHNLLEGEVEVLPDIWVHRVDGHTRGQQWIEVRDEQRSIVFPTDLIPTSRHLPVPFHMGYDICAGTILNEKEEFLKQAVEKEWIVVFQHDPDITAATVGRDEKGHYCVKQLVEVG